MIGGRMSPGLLGTCASLLVLVQAGPLLRFPRESEDYPNSDFSNYTANEVCFSDQKVFQRGEEVPNAGPCEECRCEPPSIVCQMLKCPVNNNGCRTIQRPNHCCPDYNCECDYNGQLYNDGERIDLPEDPCQVCYCKGGDVMCTSITCYQRDDCEPKRVPGQCCPKYEDCPIRDMEASNTEDKSVQTRSPNKTMNNNPKKEMQPWLLTKSVPQTSSSLAVPKSGETTTDSGNVIIVSDWLVERRTTEDFNLKQTDDPDFNAHREFITTAQPQKPTQVIVKESNFENKVQTVQPTPIDEVVFTRIDIPNKLQEEIHDSTTTTASVEIENSTSLNFSEDNKGLKKLSENTTMSSFNKYLEEKTMSANKTVKENNSSSIFEKEPENDSMTTMSSTGSTGGEPLLTQTFTIAKKAPVKIESTKYNDVLETSTPERFEIEITENSFNHNQNKGNQQTNDNTQNKTSQTNSKTELMEQFEKPINLTQSVIVSDAKDKSPEGMTLEHLFGLDELEQGDSTKQIPTSTENNSDEKYTTLPNELKNTIYTTLPAKSDKLFTNEDSEDDSLKRKPITEVVVLDKIIHVAINGSTKGENKSHLYELLTTEIPYSEEVTTTSFTSELNINNEQMQSEKFVHESNEKDKETTYLAETTTEINLSTLPVTVTKNFNDTKENLQENLIDGKQEEYNYISNIDTTTLSNTENTGITDPLTPEINTSSPPQGLQFNTISMLNNDNYKNSIQEESSYSNISNPNLVTDSTSTPDYKETTKNTLSEIEIILGETNNTNVLDKSVSSQESNEQDEVILDLSFDEISSENKEVKYANHPPVLELNSHVPFLQIGGDGNSESSETEHDQTAVVNNLDVIDNFNKKPVNRNKEIIKLTQNTVTPTTTVEALSSTKDPSNETTKEFTIPTIAVVPLTPGDLKMIAEYLISEKIKPASSKNNSMYSPNLWLKGNLTSEENIASILSAANVSIGLMNETNIGRKLETLNKSNQSGRFDKFEKETRYKSNSILDNKNVVNSKTDYLHDKNHENPENFKTTIYTQEEINNGKIVKGHLSTEVINNDIQITTAVPLTKTNNMRGQDFENFKNLNKEEKVSNDTIDTVGVQKNKTDTSLKSDKSFLKLAVGGGSETVQKIINKQTTKTFDDNKQSFTAVNNTRKILENVNMNKTDNLVKSEKIINQGTTQTVSRLSVTNEKLSETTTSNNINTTTSKVVDKPSQEGISS